MSLEEKWNDDEAWDAVADGPLTPGQLAELVAACDDRPELWKRCALALLEEQALRHELQSMAREHLNTSRKSTTVADLGAPLPCPAPVASLEPKELLTGVRAQSPGAATATATSHAAAASQPANGKQIGNILSLAALIMIAFGIGWQAAWRYDSASRNGLANAVVDGAKNDRTDSLAQADISQADISRADMAQADMANRTAGEQLSGEPWLSSKPWLGSRPWLGEPESSGTTLASTDELDPAVIDQVNAETLATAVQAGLQAGGNEELDREYLQLRRRGYEVESQEGLMPVWLYDGRSAVIPYQQIKVRPKSAGRAY